MRYEVLSGGIKTTLEEMKLAMIDSQNTKMLQFHEACQQRTGVVVVGPSGCGKSTLWKVLENTYRLIKKSVKKHLINPKSMPRAQLLGYMDHDTREWYRFKNTFAIF